MLSRLFRRKPKLTDADAARRCEALVALDASEQATFERLARDDPDPAVRVAAIARIRSPETLGALLVAVGTSESAEFRTAVADRLADLGMDHAFADHPQVAVARFRKSPGGESLEAIADPAEAIRALLGVQDFDTRSSIAQGIRDETRLTALEHLTRTRDKAIHRIARDRLAELKRLRQERDGLVRRAESLLGSAERVRADDPQLAAKCDVLRREWSTILEGLERNATALAPFRHPGAPVDALRARFHLPELAAAVPPPAGEDGRVLQSFESLLAGLVALEHRIADDPDSVEQTDDLTTRLRELQAHWSEHADHEPPSDAEARAFRDRYHRIHEVIDAFERANRTRADAATLLAVDTSFSPPQTDDDYATVWTLQAEVRRHAGRAAELLAATDWPEEVKRPRWLDALAAREDDLRRLDERCHETFSAVQTEISNAIEAMEQAVEAGEVSDASRLQGEANRWIHRLPRSAQDGPAGRLAGRSARLRELTDWQSFAERGKRETLCEEIEAIADDPLAPDAQMARIKELRGRVRALGRMRSAADRALMERFNAAAERAFEPCRIHFAALAEERRFNFEQRQVICDELETFVAGNDWEHTDYRGVEQILRQARNEWRNYHPVDRSPGKKLEARFKAVTDAIYGHLKGEWDRNVAAKQGIVDEARQAQESGAPLPDQINLMKRLQADWKRVGTTPRRVDQQLWKEFRQICDDVFQARDAQRDERRARTTTAVTEATVLIEELESELESETTEVMDPRRLAEYRRRGEAFERLPGEIDRRLHRALSDLEREVRLRRNRQPILEKLAEINQLAALDVELANLERDGASTDAWEQRADRMRDLFADRLANETVDRDEAALRRAAVEAEIGAGAESPESDQALRLEVQMARLQAGIGARERAPVDVDGLLARWCRHAAGLEDGSVLRQRFFSALRQIVDR